MSATGAAGAGAEDMARRAAAREAELEAQLAKARQVRASWEAGAAGERAVAAVLEGLGAHGWRVIHDVHWPGRPLANLDHVAVGPGGIVVIDAKNWTGTVTVRDGVLRQNGYRRDQVAANACSSAGAVTAMVAPQHRAAVRAAVCMVQQSFDPQVLPPGALLVGLYQLGAWLRSLPVVLQPNEIAVIHEYLRTELGGPRSPQLATTADLPRQPARAVEPSARARQRAPRRRPPTSTASARSRTRTSSRRSRRSGEDGFKVVVAIVVILMSFFWLKNVSSSVPDPAPTSPPPAVAPVDSGTSP